MRHDIFNNWLRLESGSVWNFKSLKQAYLPSQGHINKYINALVSSSKAVGVEKSCVSLLLTWTEDKCARVNREILAAGKLHPFFFSFRIPQCSSSPYETSVSHREDKCCQCFRYTMGHVMMARGPLVRALSQLQQKETSENRFKLFAHEMQDRTAIIIPAVTLLRQGRF